MTESLRDYTKKAIRKQYRSLDAFLKIWGQEDVQEPEDELYWAS